MIPSLSVVAAILCAATLGFMVGQHKDVPQPSPCITSYEVDGRTICIMTPEAARIERTDHPAGVRQ